MELAWFLHITGQDQRERTASGTAMYRANGTQEITGAVGQAVATLFAVASTAPSRTRHSGPPQVLGIDGVEYDFPDSTPIPSGYNVVSDEHVRRRRAV